MRQHRTAQRRQQLARTQQQLFADAARTSEEEEDQNNENHHNENGDDTTTNNTKASSSSSSSSSSSWKEWCKARLQEGLLPALAEQLEIHIRDVHIRLEDDGTSHYYDYAAGDSPPPPWAAGIVLESMHIQQAPPLSSSPWPTNTVRPDDSVIRKMAQWHRLGIYWNALHRSSSHSDNPSSSSSPEHSLWSATNTDGSSALSWDEQRRALQQSIARRINTLAATFTVHSTTAGHSYLLAPVDGTLQLSLLATTRYDYDYYYEQHVLQQQQQQQQERQQAQASYPYPATTTPVLTIPPPIPAVQISLHIPDLTVQLKDFQVYQVHHFMSALSEFRWQARHRCLFRPTVSVSENPRAWWHYAVRAIQYQFLSHTKLRWSFARFRTGYKQRQSYCQLYQRWLLSQQQQSKPPVVVLEQDHVHWNGRNATLPLSSSEVQQLQDMEDGLVGDLSVQAILLYRILVQRKIGLQQEEDAIASGETNTSQNSTGNETGTSTPKTASSWFFRRLHNAVVDDAQTEQDYERLLTMWEQWSENQKAAAAKAATAATSARGEEQRKDRIVYIQMALQVDSGKVCLFAPLEATADETEQARRLQQKYLDLVFSDYQVKMAVMKDWETIHVQMTLEDFVATEERSNRTVHAVVQSIAAVAAHTAPNSNDEPAPSSSSSPPPPPLIEVNFTKKPKESKDFHARLQASVQALEVLLVPEAEWVLRTRALMQPMPQYQKASKYWQELSMAYINVWASRRLGLLAKATHVVDDHKNIDLDVEIFCPIIRMTNGTGSEVVLDLGRAHLRTEKLAGVADSVLVNALHTTDLESLDGSSNRLGRRSKMDDLSVATPPRLKMAWRSPDFTGGSSRTLRGAGQRSVSSNLGQSIRLDDFSRGDLFVDELVQADAMETRELQVESLFYDTFVLTLEPRGLAIHTGEEADEMVGPLDVQVEIQKSIIPADHTLSKFKVRCTIEKVVVSISDDRVAKVAQLIKTWANLLASNEPLPTLAYSAGMVYRDNSLLHLHTQFASEEFFPLPDLEEVPSDKDNDEFFDAMDNESNVSDTGGLMEDNWITDSESLAESETRSFSKLQRRGRKRQSSISDVSSISEGSFTRRRSQFDSHYLNAENLARLEEDAMEGGSVEGDTVNVDGEDSFHSAVSASRLIEIQRELDHDIAEVQETYRSLKQKFTELRKERANGHDVTTMHIAKKKLQLELQRVAAELKTLEAARSDIVAQQEALAADEEEAGVKRQESIRRLTNVSVHRATSLLHRKSMRASKTSGGAEHDLMRNLNRDLFRVSLAVHNCALRVRAASSSDTNQPESSSWFEVSVADTAVVFRRRARESNIFTSIEHIYASLYEDQPTDKRQTFLLAGGFNYALSGNMLPSHFPHLVTSVTMEEKLIRCAYELRHRRTHGDTQEGVQLKKLRLSLGDVELKAHPTEFKILLETFSQLRRVASDLRHGARQNSSQSSVLAETPETSFSYIDSAIRFSSLRLALCNGTEIVGAAVVTDVSTRFAKAKSTELYRNRSQMDLHCNNIQVIAIDDFEIGKGVEVLGKKDSYSSILRARWKLQHVPEEDNGGWVTGRFTRSASGPHESSDENATWNSHILVKTEGFEIPIIPSALARLRLGVQSISTIIAGSRAHTSSSSPPADFTEKKNGKVGNPVRWRVDISMKSTTVVLKPHADAHEISDDLLSAGGRQALFSLSLIASLQQSMRDCEGIDIQARLCDISLLQAPSNWFILEPFSINTAAELPVTAPYRKCRSKPQLLRPVECPWNDSASPKQPELAGEHYESTIILTVSQIKANAVATSIAFLREMLVALTPASSPRYDQVVSINAGSLDTTNSVTVNADMSVSQPAFANKDMRVHQKKDFAIGRIFIDGLSLSLFRGRGNAAQELLHPEKILSVEVTMLEGNAEKTVEGLSLSASIGSGRLVDLTSRFAVQTLSGAGCGSDSHFAVISVSMRQNLETFSANINAKFGKINFFPLPSSFRALREFADDLISQGTRSSPTGDHLEAQGKGKGSLAAKLWQLERISVILSIQSLECSLSSRDIAKYIRESSFDPIGVVAFRLKIEAQGSCELSPIDTEHSIADVAARSEDMMANVSFAMKEFERKRATAESTVVLSSAKLLVSDCQVLRTTVTRSSLVPVSFDIASHLAGEQRITNNFNFTVTHHVAAAFLPCSLCESQEATLSACHALQIKADFIDVLVYIASSSGGLTDCLKATVVPIVELMGKKSDQSETDRINKSKKTGLKEKILAFPVVVSARADGIQVTCVPGGATRLTESPIVKFAMLDVSGGCASTPASGSFHVISETNVDGMAELSGTAIKNLVAGAWINCDVSADYHNRRLVAWEPFIEPWRLEMMVGADLSQTIGLQPIQGHVLSPPHRSEGEVIQPSRLSSLDLGSTRLRDIGRLLRAPFQNDRALGRVNEVDQSGLGSDVDYCFLALLLVAKNIITAASYPLISSVGPHPTMVLPNERPMHWLHRFGYPSDHDLNDRAIDTAVRCKVTDTLPLNVNITFALVDNLWEVLAKDDSDKSKRMVPHWIRNETGLVSLLFSQYVL